MAVPRDGNLIHFLCATFVYYSQIISNNKNYSVREKENIKGGEN